MKLVHNWRKSYRMYSQQALAAIVGIQGVVLVLKPDSLVPIISQTSWWPGMTWSDMGYALSIAVAVLGFIGRLVDQGHTTEVNNQ